MEGIGKVPHSAFSRACDRRAIGAAALRWGQKAPATYRCSGF